MQPLAERLRPKTLDDFVGQEHLLGPHAPLRQAILSGQVPSFILWGPPGVGKTSIASVIAQTLSRPYYALSAINSGVKDIRETIQKAEKQKFFNSPNPILFIDEIHRFSKSQQDSLLGAVEKGVITLIGATTENPSFEVISALLSRCQVYILESLGKNELELLVQKALSEDLQMKHLNVKIESLNSLLRHSGGDGRKLLNALELVLHHQESEEVIVISDEKVSQILQKKLVTYDKQGENHYDIISAFIKSIRGSDPNAAVYYLARMIEGGEDPKFICRRMIISASEDIGLANPNALLLANQCMAAVQNIGMPEGRIVMSQAAIYLACSAKSNASYLAIKEAQALVKSTGDLSVPLNLRNAPTQLMKEIGYGKDYQYSHDFPGNFVAQEYLPSDISGTVLYQPGRNPAENNYAEKLRKMWKEKYGY